jgi:hypothetical protein
LKNGLLYLDLIQQEAFTTRGWVLMITHRDWMARRHRWASTYIYTGGSYSFVRYGLVGRRRKQLPIGLCLIDEACQ